MQGVIPSVHHLRACFLINRRSLLTLFKHPCSWGPVHTTPQEFENADLFLQLGVPSTLIRFVNGAFPLRKRSSNPRNLKTPALRISVDGKHLENVAFRKRWHHDNHVNFPCPSSPLNHKSRMTGYCYVFKFLRRSVDAKHLMRFRSETSVFKFFWRPFSTLYKMQEITYVLPRRLCEKGKKHVIKTHYAQRSHHERDTRETSRSGTHYLRGLMTMLP